MNKVLERTAAACEVGKNLIVRIGKEKHDHLADFSDTEPVSYTHLDVYKRQILNTVGDHQQC